MSVWACTCPSDSSELTSLRQEDQLQSLCVVYANCNVHARVVRRRLPAGICGSSPAAHLDRRIGASANAPRQLSTWCSPWAGCPGQTGAHAPRGLVGAYQGHVAADGIVGGRDLGGSANAGSWRCPKQQVQCADTQQSNPSKRDNWSLTRWSARVMPLNLLLPPMPHCPDLPPRHSHANETCHAMHAMNQSSCEQTTAQHSTAQKRGLPAGPPRRSAPSAVSYLTCRGRSRGPSR